MKDNQGELLLLLLSSSSSSSPLCRVFILIFLRQTVPREYSVAAILLLLFMVLISLVSVLNLLCFYISTFRSVCAVPNVAVCCSSLTSCFPGMLLMCVLNDIIIIIIMSSLSSSLCRVCILIFLKQTMSLGNTVLQLFCCYYSWYLYR